MPPARSARDALLAEAMEAGSASMQRDAFSLEGFDIDAAVHAMHHSSPCPRTIARVLVDDIVVESVRSRVPVLDGLLSLVQLLPGRCTTAALADPRLAATAGTSLVVGSVIWGRVLRQAFGLGDQDGVESAIADISRWLPGAAGAQARGSTT